MSDTAIGNRQGRLEDPSQMSKDVFPHLDLQELVVCLQSCDFSLATEENISRPTSQCMITLYKQIIDSFMGISPDALLNDRRNFEDRGRNGDGGNGNSGNDGNDNNGNSGGNNDDNYGDNYSDNDNDNDAVYNNTLRVLALNKICFKFFQDIGVPDFCIMDLYKPDPQRTRRLLSAVVNYARFREERMFDCDQFMTQTEALLGLLRQKFDDYNFLQQQMNKYGEDSGLAGGEDLTVLEERNKNLESQLKKLTQIQETLTIDYNSYKSSKQKLLGELESLGFELIELESQRDKLQRYSQTDLQELHTSVKELSQLLQQQQEKLARFEAKQKNLHVSVETFQALTQDLYDVLQIISSELQESHLRETGLLELKKQLVQTDTKLKNLLSSGVLVKLGILQSQLDNQRQKLADLEKTTGERQRENSETLAGLQSRYSEEVVPELRRVEEHIQKELVAGVVQALNADMHTLRKEFQKEVDSIELEYALLASHINKYMETMLEKMR